MGRCVKKSLLLFLIFILVFITPIFAYNNTIEPINPSYLLQFGDNMVYDNSEYVNTTEISNELKDNNSLTAFNTFFAYAPESYDYLIDGWSFNNVTTHSAILYSFTGGHDGEIIGDIDYIKHDDYYKAYFDGVNDYIRVTDDDGSELDLFSGDEFTMCAVFDTTMDISSHRYLIEKTSGGVGYYMRYDADEQITCRFDGDVGAQNSVGTTSLDDGETHTVCCRLDGDVIDLWVDGVVEDSDVRTLGSQQNTQDLFIGTSSATGGRWEGNIHQIGLFNKSLSNSTLINMVINHSVGDLNKGMGISVYFNHTFEEGSEHKHFLMVDSEQSHITTLRVATQENMTTINKSNYKDFQITSGVNYLPLSNLAYHNYNNPFRLWDLLGETTSTISEINIYETINDTTNPSIDNCSVNTTSITCGEVVRLQCDVHDNDKLYKTYFTATMEELNLTGTEEANKLNGVWYIDKSYSTQVLDTMTITWDSAITYDLNENFNETFPDLKINYSCCLENWIPTWTNSSCLINDTFTANVVYNDATNCGSTVYLPEDNGTMYNPSCDFCISDIVEDRGLCTYQDSTYVRNVSYVDNLYPFCCDITGIDSDCGVDFSPYNETYQEYCTIFNNTMECDSNTYTEFGFFGDKARWLCYPPVSNNETTNCMSYVRDVHTGVIQTNPNYYTQSESLISLNSEVETRTSFEAVGNMVSVYFTKDNIMFDGREYVFGVRCTNNGDYYDYEMLITPEYENVNSSITRWMWFKDNLVGIFFASVISFVLIIIIAGYIRELRRR